MIKVEIRNNLDKHNDIIDENATIRAAFEGAGIDYSRGTIYIDGAPLGVGKINSTFAEFGYDGTPGHDRCTINCVIKVDNAK